MGEVTIEALQKENAELKKENAALKATDANKALEKVQKEFADYKLDAEAKILAERADNPNAKVRVKVKGKDLAIQFRKINHKGVIYTAEELAKQPTVLEEIYKTEGQGVLKED